MGLKSSNRRMEKLGVIDLDPNPRTFILKALSVVDSQ